MTTQYSKLGLIIDLISNEFKTTNPILIAEYAQKELDEEVTIHQVCDYLDINKFEDYELESKKQMFNFNY